MINRCESNIEFIKNRIKLQGTNEFIEYDRCSQINTIKYHILDIYVEENKIKKINEYAAKNEYSL